MIFLLGLLVVVARQVVVFPREGGGARTFSPVDKVDIGFHFSIFKNLNIVLRTSRRESIFTRTSIIHDGINYSDINDSRLIPAVKFEEQYFDF